MTAGEAVGVQPQEHQTGHVTPFIAAATEDIGEDWEICGPQAMMTSAPAGTTQCSSRSTTTPETITRGKGIESTPLVTHRHPLHVGL
jgi:hypothetical protein